MDIDEFLDRELSDLGFGTDKTEEPRIADIFDSKEQFEPSPLFENIKSSLGKGGLEQAEQSYIQLWHILLEQKLKWNKELYEQLLAVSKQFSSALNYAYNDVKKKAEHVYELINRAKAALREGKKELPFKIYSEIDQINSSIPNVFFEDKKIVEQQIMDFYRELKNTTDNELIKRVSALIAEINHVMDRISISIRSSDMINAIVNYNKCIELYNQIPEGFLRYKNSAGMRLLDIYKSLSIYTEMSNLQKQLNYAPSLEPIQFAPQQAKQQAMPGLFEKANAKGNAPSKTELLNAKKERAKKNIEKGFYNEASKDIQEALELEPNDAEAKAIRAKIKTLE